MDKIEELIAEYGDPIYRKVIDRSDLTEDQIMFGDVAAEIAVFKIKHPSKVMIVGRHGRGWSCNYGERTAVVELLNELTRLRAEVERLRDVLGSVRGRVITVYKGYEIDEAIQNNKQQAKVEICENAIPKDWLCRLDNKICLGQCGKSTEQAKG